MVDCVFFVTSALKSIESIQKYCPSNSIHLIDASHENPPQDQLNVLSNMGVDIYRCSEKHDVIKDLARKGHKSVCELAILKFFFQEYAPKRENCKRFYKLSGRYWLNEHFKHSFEHFQIIFDLVSAGTINFWIKCFRDGFCKLFFSLLPLRY